MTVRGCGRGSKAHSILDGVGGAPPGDLAIEKGVGDLTSPIVVLEETIFGNDWENGAKDHIRGQGGTSFGENIHMFIARETSLSGNPLAIYSDVV